MTRFARAKGSKSANERAPEDGTPWEVMQEQLAQSKKEAEENKKRQEADKKRQENYDNFLKEQKVAKRKSTWCDFPEDNKKVKTETVVHDKTAKSKNKKKKSIDSSSHEIITKNIKKESFTGTVDTTVNNISPQKKAKKNKSKNKLKQAINNDETNVDKKQLNVEVTETTSDNKSPQKQNKKKKKEMINESIDTTNDGTKNKETVESLEPKNHEKKKNINSKKPRRKPIDDHSFCLIINGKEVELQRFDGFPVMKKDAERLQQLKQNMVNKGIPKSEVMRTIKLERRRAEKALTRMKKDVCYNCRKGGHNLSDCPELKSKISGVEFGDGICFKCGSTEHRSVECKVQKDQGFRFATCFICKEQGHIARQCPDNPKGLYPNGGGCKLCGDVTHLRKDCPTSQDKREESNIRLDTYDNVNNLEGIGDEKANSKSTEEKPKMPKKIRF